jgi:hypothetical protein
MSTTPIPQNVQVVDINQLFAQKGEIVTQLEILQGKLQIINQQLSQILNQQNQNKPA